MKQPRFALPRPATVALCAGWLTAFASSYVFFYFVRMLARLIGGLLIGLRHFRIGFHIGRVDGEVVGLAEFAPTHQVTRQIENARRAETGCIPSIDLW